MTTLRTARLVLRPLELGDATALHAVFGDARAMAWWDSPPIADTVASTAMIARQCAEAAAGTHLYWSVVAGGECAGAVDLSEIDQDAGCAEVGYILAPAWWGRRLATEAMTAVIDHAAARGLHRLTARSHVGNVASLRLLARLGFVASHTSQIVRAGEVRDCLWCERRGTA